LLKLFYIIGVYSEIMDTLELMLQSSELYAPYTGVALTSYLENNKNIDQIVVHFLADNVSKINKDRIINTVKKYNRIVHVYEVGGYASEIAGAGFSEYHGSYTTFCKLYLIDKIQFVSDRVLYVDSDTLCNGSLKKILDIKLDDHICAMTTEINTLFQIKNHIPVYHRWYNAGVILFNVNKWKKERCLEIIKSYLNEYKPCLRLADQDLLNLLFRDKIVSLPHRYNYIYTYTLLPGKYGRDVWKWGKLLSDELEREKKQVVIWHCMPVFGRRPWDIDAYVPKQVEWDYFLELSEWKKELKKINKEQNAASKIQEFLFMRVNPFIYYLFYKIAIIQIARRGAKGLPYMALLDSADNFWRFYKRSKR